MHPSMYGDQLGSNYNLRERMKCRRKLLNGNTASQREADSESSQATSELDRSVSGSDDQIDKLGTAESFVPASLILPANKWPYKLINGEKIFVQI